jgi:hypothetical protein
MGVNLLVVDAPNWDDAARVQDGVKKTTLFQEVEEPLTYVRLDPASTNANSINALARQQRVSFILMSSSQPASVHGRSCSVIRVTSPLTGGYGLKMRKTIVTRMGDEQSLNAGVELGGWVGRRRC